MRWYKHCYPEGNKNVVEYVSEKEILKSSGVVYKALYPEITDKEILEDWITVNWAEPVKQSVVDSILRSNGSHSGKFTIKEERKKS